MSRKIYHGTRDVDGCHVLVTDKFTDKSYSLPTHLEVYRHSPDGFEWGYGGSGPAQLALALLVDHLQDPQEALRIHQDFKRFVIVPMQSGAWFLTSQEIDEHIKALAWKAAA